MIHPGDALSAVVFDLDGTLIDTADDFIPAVQTLRREQGLTSMAEEQIRASVSNGSRALVRLALSIDEDHMGFEQHRERLLQLYANVLGKYAALYPGLGELLSELTRRNIAWGIATNKPRAYTVPLLDKLALTPAVIVCPDDVAEPKPHPESLHKACARLNCRSDEAIYIGDHLRDIEAGKRAGMFTIAAAYGYIEADDSAERWGADLLIDRSEALGDAVFNGKMSAYEPSR